MRGLILFSCFFFLVSFLFGETTPEARQRFESNIAPVFNFYNGLYKLFGLILVAACGVALKKAQSHTAIFYIILAFVVLSFPILISVLLNDVIGLN